METSLKILMRASFDVLFPRKCVVCGRELLLCEDVVCMCCQADIPLTMYECVSRNPMADKLNNLLTEDATEYVYALALFFYQGDYKLITPALKYGRNFECGRYFSAMLGARLKSCPWLSDIDCIVPVPLHWTRKYRRGYNQAEVIARAVAEEWLRDSDRAVTEECLKGTGEVKSPVVDAGALVRVRRTSSQASLEKEDKKGNVSGAFRFRGFSSKGADYRHVLLIDDVFTTGNTLAECWRALHRGFKGRISIATLAFAGKY